MGCIGFRLSAPAIKNLTKIDPKSIKIDPDRPKTDQKSKLAVSGSVCRLQGGSRVPSPICGVHQKSTFEPDMTPKYTILALPLGAKIDQKSMKKSMQKSMEKS